MKWRTWTRVPKVSVFGAPVYAHWSVALAVVVVGLLSFNSPIHAALAIVSYLAVIVIHELGHAWVAQRLGCEVLNLRVAFLHGACEYEAADTLWENVLIAWGGVAAQLLAAAVVLSVAALLGDRDAGYFGPVIAFLGYVNLLFALVNLAPSPYLDGSTAWRIVPLLWRRYRARPVTRKSALRLVKRK